MVEVSCEAVWFWAFVCWEISDYSFDFHAYDVSVKIFYFFLVQFWNVVLLNIQKMKIMASDPITSWQIDGETVETMSDIFGGSPKSLQMVTSAMKLKDTYSLEEKL